MEAPSAEALAWEAAARERSVLGAPEGSVLAPASLPYALEIVSTSASLPSEDDGAPTCRASVSLYDKEAKAMFGRTWESAPLPWPQPGEPLQIATTVALHTPIVSPGCTVVVEIVRGEGDEAVSVGWSAVPLFAGASRLREEFGPEIETPVFAGTPRYLLFDNEPPSEEALPDCLLRTRVRTAHATLGAHQQLLRENEVVALDEEIVGLSGSLAAPAAPPTCSITLSELSFAIPGVVDADGATDISKLSFDDALMKYLQSVTAPEVWASAEGVKTACALVGVHNVSARSPCPARAPRSVVDCANAVLLSTGALLHRAPRHRAAREDGG